MDKDDTATDIKTAREDEGEEEIGGGLSVGVGRVDLSISTASLIPSESLGSPDSRCHRTVFCRGA